MSSGVIAQIPQRVADCQTTRTEAAFRAFLETLDLDLDEPNLVDTPRRVARAYREMFAGLRPESAPVLTTFPNDATATGVVSVGEIPFYSLCSHHFLPFFGSVHISYLPGDRLLGLSKFARVVEYFARRPQLQERLTSQIAGLIHEQLEPKSVQVVIEARHLCMEMRGVAKAGAVTRTEARL